MTGRRVEHGFRKKQRTGSGRIAQRFIKKPPRVIHATARRAENNSQRAVRSVERLVGCGHGELADRAGASHPWVGQTSRARYERRGTARPQRLLPSGTFYRRELNRFAGDRATERRHAPTRRRKGAQPRDVDAAHSCLRTTSVAWAPPNPNELVIAWVSVAAVGVDTTGNAQAGSSV